MLRHGCKIGLHAQPSQKHTNVLEIVKVLLKETLIVLFLIVLDSKNLKSV